MSMQDMQDKLAAINAQVDALKSEARVICRQMDQERARDKIAAMPEAEKQALIELMKGQ